MSEICNVGPAERQARLERASDPSSGLNAVEYLEVLDRRMPGGLKVQQTLIVVCIKDLTDTVFGRQNVQITGGVRVTDIPVLWAYEGTTFYDASSQTVPPPPADIPAGEAAAISQVIENRFASRTAQILVVRTGAVGDFSTYTLRLTNGSGGTEEPANFDQYLSSVDFSFKIECPSEFDCHAERACPTDLKPAPAIDYLAKDYDSFRGLILDRLSVLMPDWKERNPADLGVTLVELLAYVGDQLSYYQDVVANEAYLGTSRFRSSVRRHARLLDYRLHEGSNARTWVHLSVPEETTAPVLVPAHTKLLSRRPHLGDRKVLSQLEAQQEIDAGATVFETMAEVEIRHEHNKMYFHLWGAPVLVLAKGTTCATLRNTNNDLAGLRAGDVIALVEARAFQQPYAREDADPNKRHVVRLSKDPVVRTDHLFPEPGSSVDQRLLDIEWDAADALPFDLCIRELDVVEDGETRRTATSYALGNLVLADHGNSASDTLTPVARGTHKEAFLADRGLTFQGQVKGKDGRWQLYDPTAPASSALSWDRGRVRPCIDMQLLDAPAGSPRWEPYDDLLDLDAFKPAFVVETEDDGTTRVRFGDGISGRLPDGPLDASYRVGSGTAGNIGKGTLAHIVLEAGGPIEDVTNVTPASGGSDPEPIEHAILVAPHAFRTQERAVTEADYARVAERHVEVQRAVAMRRFVGSWDVFYISVDRKGNRPFDEAFRQEMRAFIEPYRLAGHDVEIREPKYVPLDIALPICVRPGHMRSQVLVQLRELFSAVDLPGKPKGFFHPDRWTFGQPVYLSRIIATAMSVPGVQAVLTDPWDPEFWFRRYLSPEESGKRSGVLKIAVSEIACVTNDVNQPMNGQIRFQLRGGL